MGAAAGAGGAVQHTDVPGAVANQGEGFLGDGGEYQFPLGAIGKNLASVRVNDLRDEMVLTNVHSVLVTALVGNARAGELCQAIDVIGLNAQFVLNVLAHLLRPGLGAKDASLQLNLIPQPPFDDALCQEGGVGGGAAKDGGLQVAHELDLTVCVARRHGQGQASHLVGATVEAGAPGE